MPNLIGPVQPYLSDDILLYAQSSICCVCNASWILYASANNPNKHVGAIYVFHIINLQAVVGSRSDCRIIVQQKMIKKNTPCKIIGCLFTVLLNIHLCRVYCITMIDYPNMDQDYSKSRTCGHSKVWNWKWTFKALLEGWSGQLRWYSFQHHPLSSSHQTISRPSFSALILGFAHQLPADV